MAQTRKEKIEKQAKDYSLTYQSEELQKIAFKAYVEGAKWAAFHRIAQWGLRQTEGAE